MTVKMTRVWDATTEFLNERASAVFAVAAGMIFAPALVSGVLERSVAPNTPGMAAVQLIGIVLSLVTAAGALAITALAIRPMRAGEAAGIGARRLLPFFGVSIAVLAVVFVAVIPVVAILIAGGVDLEALAAGSIAAPGMGTGMTFALLGYMVVAFVVAIWVSARLVVLLPVIVAERRGLGAIGRAWHLTRGHALKIVGLLLLYGIVAAVLSGGIGAAVGAIGTLLGAGQPGLSVGAALVAVVLAVISTMLSVVQSAFTGKLYTALAPAGDLEDIFA